MSRSGPNLVVKYLEKTCWVAMLLWLVLISMSSAAYQSVSWMIMSAVLYGICVFYTVAIMLGCSYNSRALKRGRLVIVLAALPLFWLYLQTVLPLGNTLLSGLLPSSSGFQDMHSQALVSVDVIRTRHLLYSYLPPFICLLLMCTMLTKRSRIKHVLYLSVFLLLLHSAVGIYAKYSGIYFIDESQLDGHWSAARGWFVNRNHYAAFILSSLLGLLSFIAYYSREQQASPYVMVVLAFLVLISLVAVVLSQSRAGLVCWVFIFISSGLMTLRSVTRDRGDWANRRSLPMIAILSLVGVALVGMFFGAEMWSRLESSTLSIGERGLQWDLTWQAISQSPWFGYGGGSYAQVFQYFRGYSELRQVIFDQSHNHYLHLWLEQGLVGLVLWLGLIAITFKKAVAGIRDSKSNLVISVSFAACFVIGAALIQSLVDFNLQIINLRCFFFVIIGIILALPSAR